MGYHIISRLVLLSIILVGSCCVWIYDYNHSEQKTIKAVVECKSYTPSKTSTGIGTGVGANGKITTVTTTTYESEEYTLIVKNEFGKIIPIKCTPHQFVKYHEKDKIEYIERKGKFTHIVYSDEIKQ